jgi:hypothetical protein
MDARSLEKILRRTNKTLDAERAALARGTWKTYLAERVPPPSRLNVFRYRAWRAAYQKALELGCTTNPRDACILPIWYCSNQDDDATGDWATATLISFEDESNQLYENTPLRGVVVRARVEEARLGFIVRSRGYAEAIELPYRNSYYAAVQSRRIERVTAIEQLIAAEPAPKPEREVPAFSTDAESAISLAALDPELAGRIRRATEKLRIFPDPEA